MRGVAATGAIPSGAECTRCRARYRQHSDGLCRLCHKAGDRRDPAVNALATLSRFIDRTQVDRLFKDASQQRQIERLAVEARNALDLVRERLKAATLQQDGKEPT